VFIYGCKNIMPHQAVALGKAIGSFEYITDKRCIVHEPKMDWFKMHLKSHNFWVLQPCRHKGWAQRELCPCVFIDEEQELEEWVIKMYPGAGDATL
jgi:hypothetical protein